MRAAVVGVLLAATACGGELVETRRRVKGPVPSIPWIDVGGGHARYSLKGPAFAARQRRDDVMARVAAYCGGETKYRIVDEMDRDETETSFRAEDVEQSMGEGAKHYRPARMHHVYFECVQ